MLKFRAAKVAHCGEQVAGICAHSLRGLCSSAQDMAVLPPDEWASEGVGAALLDAVGFAPDAQRQQGPERTLPGIVEVLRGVAKPGFDAGQGVADGG